MDELINQKSPPPNMPARVLELDRVGLCWGEDMTWSAKDNEWKFRAFRGNKWMNTN